MAYEEIDKYKYMKYKAKYLQEKNKMLGGAISQQFIESIDKFADYQYPDMGASVLERKHNFTQYLKQIADIGAAGYGVGDFSFVTVRGDGLCFFSAVVTWLTTNGGMDIRESDAILATLTDVVKTEYRRVLIEKLTEYGEHFVGDDRDIERQLRDKAPNYALQYPLSCDAPQLELLCKIISQMYNVNIVLIYHDVYKKTRFIKVFMNADPDARTIFLYNTGGHISAMTPKIFGAAEYNNVTSERIFVHNLLEYNLIHPDFMSVERN